MELLKRNYLENKPVRLIDFNTEAVNLFEDLNKQTLFLTTLFRREYQQSIKYRKAFLKKFSVVVENSGFQLCDLFYELITELMLIDDRESSFYKTFSLPNSSKSIVMIEEIAIISNGTTGLTTWAASLYLLEYLSVHTELIKGKKILELGSGAGLMGICFEQMGAKSIIMTDGSEEVLLRARQNVALNASSCDVEYLKWGENISKEFDFDAIICADVVYNPALVGVFVETLLALVQDWHGICIVSITTRNLETFELFLQTCSANNIVLRTLPSEEFKEDSWFYYQEGNATIQIFELFFNF
jgi:2-polyprenyl-3-methyl-5-hydroxy-6-metoxy-1,4-benzoquinol methylase